MAAYIVIFSTTERDGSARVFRAVVFSASPWAARVEATRGYSRAVVESVEHRHPHVNPRVFVEQLPN